MAASSSLIVSDTTALTTLMKCDLEWVLPRLFGRVVIPVRVSHELLVFHSALPEWCTVQAAPAGAVLSRLLMSVDAGEAEAIALSFGEGATLLIDDKQGRREAESIGVICLGLPAILLRARGEGVIPSLADALELLAKTGQHRVRETVAKAMLRSVGEA